MDWIKQIINGGKSATTTKPTTVTTRRPTSKRTTPKRIIATTKPTIRPKYSVNSGWSAWSSWTDCIRCSGNKIRTRLCDSADCPGSEIEQQNCSDQPECSAKIDEWSSWSAWSTCSTSCRGGVKRRTRFCFQETCYGSAIDIQVRVYIQL